MKTNKPRNRESRTKPIPTESSVAIRLRLPRESYDQMRDLVKNRRATKEELPAGGKRRGGHGSAASPVLIACKSRSARAAPGGVATARAPCPGPARVWI